MKHKQSHSLRNKLADIRDSIDGKEMISILLLEAGTLLMMGRYGNLVRFFPITVMLVVFTLIMCVVCFWFKANVAILISTIALTNIGFIVQTVHPSNEIDYIEFAKKCAFALALLCAAFILFPIVAHYMSSFWGIVVLMAVQYGVFVAMWIANAKIEGVTWLELVKAIYALVLPGLICGNQFDREIPDIMIRLRTRELKIHTGIRLGTLVLLIHTFILSLGFIKFSEMGTLLVIWAVFLMSGWIFCKNRKTIILLCVLFISSFLAFWMICDRMLYPALLEKNLSKRYKEQYEMIKSEEQSEEYPEWVTDFVTSLEPEGSVEKLIIRFGAARHPEKVYYINGYQGTLGLSAIVLGGGFGVLSERHMLIEKGPFYLPESNNDFLFDGLVHIFGGVVGAFIILMYIALLINGFRIADNCEIRYFKCLAITMTIMILIEAVIHIGYNLALLPITGIPLYFCSGGFFALTTGMAFIGILLAISTGKTQ